MTIDIEQFIKDNAILDSDDKVVVKQVWDGRYRVNVWKYNPNRIVQSFFIRTDDNGVVQCSPDVKA